LKQRLVRQPEHPEPKPVIFVMSDETPIHIGGPPRHNQFVSTREGALAHELSLQVDRHPKFTLQLLAACCSDHSILRPHKTFIQHSNTEKQEIQAQLDRCHRLAKERATAQIATANSNPNSSAAQVVRKANIAMREKHEEDIAAGKKVPKTKRDLKLDQVFKVDKKDFERTAEKGMDFA